MTGRLAAAAVAALAASVLAAGCTTEPPAPPWTPQALACGEPCKALLDATPGQAWEPHVAIHPGDPLRIAVASRTVEAGERPGSFSAWFNVHATADGGRTWTVTPLRYTKPLGEGAADEPNVVGDPVLAFLPDGSLVATGATLQYIGLQAGLLANVKLYAVRSPDGGVTFEEPVVVAEGEGFLAVASLPAPLPSPQVPLLLHLPDKPWITAGPDGTVLLAWSDLHGSDGESPAGWRSDIRYVLSRDGGRTWGESRVAASGASLSGPSPVVAGGLWAIAYLDFDAQETRLAASSDGGATWSDFRVGPNLWMPSLAAHGGRLYAAGSHPGPDSRQAPSLQWSDDGGATWTAPLLLDGPAPGRVLPSVAVDAAGTAYVTYTHAGPRDQDSPVSFRAAALRPDGGRWGLVLDPVIAAPAESLGDYLGLAAGRSGAYAAWVTTADGRQFDLAGASLWAE
jgi:hypothetical protein